MIDAFNGPILPFFVGIFNGRRGTCTLFSWVLWGFFAIYLALPASLWYSIMADLISKAASIKGALQQGAERGDRGDVPKWFKGPHSKCGRPGDRCVGSNPTISATKKHLRSRSRRCFCVFWRLAEAGFLSRLVLLSLLQIPQRHQLQRNRCGKGQYIRDRLCRLHAKHTEDRSQKQ